jgi:hypothetical protein
MVPVCRIRYAARRLRDARRILICGAFAALLGACAGSTSTDGDEKCPVANHVGCAQARGVYSITYNERQGGTCGPKESFRGEVANTRVTSFEPPCAGMVDWSSDFCEASFEATCPAEEFGTGYRNKQVSHTTYSMDGMIRTGTFELTVFDTNGDVFCQSLYDSLAENASCQQ